MVPESLAQASRKLLRCGLAEVDTTSVRPAKPAVRQATSDGVLDSAAQISSRWA